MEIKRKGYVYILHFESPISESHYAQHYCGATLSPLERMQSHARGLGARITQVARERHIRFKLAALGVCDAALVWGLERRLKKWHGVSGHCACCTPDPMAIPETTPYPLEMIRWPLWSDEIEEFYYQMKYLQEQEEDAA